MKKQDKTNVMRVLDQKKIPYESYTYDSEKAISGMEVATVLGQNPNQVFKTLVTVGASKKNYVFVVPVCGELNLKKAAKAVEEKSIEMIRKITPTSITIEKIKFVCQRNEEIDYYKQYFKDNDSSTIAENIVDYFPDTSLNDLITIVDEYKQGDAWKDDISINEDEWKHIQDIIISAGELDTYAPYQDLIYTKYFDDNE